MAKKTKSYAEMTREERVIGVKENAPVDKESREYKATHKEK